MQLASRVVSDNIILTSNVEPDVPDVDVDPNQFWKVIFNILKNASEAIGDTPGRIRVRVVPFKMTEYEATNFVSEHPLSSVGVRSVSGRSCWMPTSAVSVPCGF